MRRPRFAIIYAPEVGLHVGAIPSRSHSALREAIRLQLTFEPGRRTRNRKPLEDMPGPFGSTWELRCGAENEFRVFYEFDASVRQVRILAIGVKDRDRLFIAGREFVP